MDFMFDWETEGDHFSFEDSDRFEEDSLCSWNSEPESVCNNWRGWKRQNGGQAFPVHHQQQQQQRISGDKISTLVEMAAQAVACHIPFEVVENFRQPVPDQLQLRIAFWSFPENEEDIRLYSCLANGSSDEFQKGEHLYKIKAVKEALQIGFHLSASVLSLQSSTQSKGSFNVAVVFDRRRITTCMCTCGSTAWCSHVVALCLYRIHQAHSVCLRAPVSESLSRLRRDQLQKFAQYLISELPQQILPTAQKLLDELLSSQETAMNTVYGAPDPTAGPSASEQTSWCLDPDTLHENIKKTLVKFCVPSPMVFSDVNYLSSSAPPAAAEWQSLLRPLRGREPEGMWNLLSIVREMFRRSDNNAVPLLEILTDEVLQCEQILVWWFATKLSSAYSGNGNHGNRSNSNSSANASQHAAASFCDEIVTLWRLAALNPKLSPIQRDDLCAKFRDWHMSSIDKVRKNRGAGFGSSPVSLKKLDIESFTGFKLAVEACSLDWEEYDIPGVTYSEGFGTQYHISRIQETETKKLSRVQTVAVCSQDLISSDNSTRCKRSALGFDPTVGADRREPHYFFNNISGPGLVTLDVGNADPVHSSGSEGFCEPDKSDTETTRNSSSSSGKNKSVHRDSIGSSEFRPCAIYDKNFSDSLKFSVVVSDTAGDSDASLPGTSGSQDGAKSTSHTTPGGDSPHLEPNLSAESQPSSDEYQLYFYDPKAILKSSETEKKRKDKSEEPNYFSGLKTVYSKQDIWFARAEALHAHGHNKEACKLAQKLSEEILLNPPDFLGETNNMQPPKGKKKKVQNGVSLLASMTLAKAAFLCNVLSEDPECHSLAFKIGKHFIFDLFCLPASPACGNSGKSPNRSSVQMITRLPSYEKLGFEAAVAALGLKANVSEAEHPLLCEGTRRQRGDLAITMLVHYKDDQAKLSKVMDKLLDKEIHQMYKAPSLSTYLSSKSGSHQSTAGSAAAEAALRRAVQRHGKEEEGATASSSSLTAAAASTSASIGNHPASVVGRLDLPQSAMLTGSSGSVAGDPDQSGWQNSPAQRLDYLNLEQGQAASSNHSNGARPKTMYSLKYNSTENTDSSALEEDGDDHLGFDSQNRMRRKYSTWKRMSTWPAVQRQMVAQRIRVHPRMRTLSSCLEGVPSRRGLPRVARWQAMEIGSAAINILIDTWEGHLTPPEVASLADRASRGRDPTMVKAASELALSCLPHAHALNPTEVQRALLQCKEHSKEMLEKACLAVESAAKGGGVYPEVLFEVARHWDKMAEESAHLGNSGGTQGRKAQSTVSPGDQTMALELSRIQDEDSNLPLIVESVGDQANSSALPMIPFNQQGPHTSGTSGVSSQSTPPPPPPPPQIILHSSNHLNHPAPMVIPYTLPGPAQGSQIPHHPTTYVPTYSFFNHHHQYPPPPPPPPPQTTHIPLHNNMHHPGAYITTYSYQNQAPFTVGNMQNVHHSTAQIFNGTSHIRHLGPTVQIYPNPNCQVSTLQPMHGNSSAATGTNVQHVEQPPVFTPCQPTSSTCVPGQQQQQQQQMCVPGQPLQQGSQASLQPSSVINNQTQMNYLMAAYRVGMLAMETLGRNDRPQMKYARNPPYGEDVKRLLGVALKLGSSYLQQFCASAVNAVVSPFVLYDIAWEAAHYLARNNPTQVHNCLRSNFLNPLVQKCIQM
ncbi:Zinc finger SWIM domain-containing protein 8 [Acanthosepion pharaonis]|uniref:Zinc finger SWIM domain-containing protein 8 n=1 Tax=Acanthosepion pharaonis TaxID=158019 RepID=A0A812CQ75_ACAPH|nr:Zinc finger SWIM domain-containing protein 8 [Sepia pharaonis]